MVTICALLWLCCSHKHQAESEKGKLLSRTGRNGARFVKVPMCDTTLSEISRFVPERWPHFQKKVLKAYIFPECTCKINANDIYFKNKFFLKSFGMEGSV